MIEFVGERIDQATARGADLERERVAAYFEFFQRNRGFLRVLNEAVVFASAAFKKYVRDFANRYATALRVQRDAAETHPQPDEQLEALVH